MATSVLFAQRRLGAGASNALTQRGANVGIGTDTPQAKIQVYGDAIVTGLVTDSNYNPIVGAIANWLTMTPAPSFGTAGTGAGFSYSQATGSYRGSGNEIVYNVHLGATMTAAAATATADFTIPLPYTYATTYASNAILGEMWLSVVYGGLSNVFKALARANPANNATATVRFLSGTSEVALGALALGATVNLQGTLLYTTTTSTRLMPPTPATVTAQTITSNVAPVFGSGFTWHASPTTPALTVPGTAFPSSYFTPTAAVGQVRYLGTDVAYQVKIDGTVAIQPTSTTSNYVLNLPYPADLATTYTSETVIGELWLSVTTAETLATPGGSNNFKAFARTRTGDPNAVTIRVLSGTTEDTLASLTAGAVIRLQGTLNYETTTIYNGDIYTSYLPPVFSQDFAGQVTVNGSGYPPRGQLDVIGTTTLPALVADARGATNAIAEFRADGRPMLTIGRDGLFYDANNTASFVPSGMVQWIGGPTTDTRTSPVPAPTIAPGFGGALSNVTGSARHRYGGNSFAYQFERQFVVLAAPSPAIAPNSTAALSTAAASNYTLTLPYPLDPLVYTSADATLLATAASNATDPIASAAAGTALGNLVLTVVNAANTVAATYAGYAKIIPGDTTRLALRYLNGTTEGSLSEFATGTRITLRGAVEYTSAQVSAPLSQFITSNVFYRDNDGRVSLGTDQPPRARLDIGETAPSIPAVIVQTTSGTADALRIRTAATPSVGDAALVIDANANVGIGTTLPRGLLDVTATLSGGAGRVVVDTRGNLGIGTTLPAAGLSILADQPVKVDQLVAAAEFPPVGASNAGYYADYGATVDSIDAGTPMTLAEFPPVGLTSADTTTSQSITVSGAFYGNGTYVTSASSTYLNAPTYPPWKAFNKTLTDGNDAWVSAGSLYSSGVASSPSTTVSGVTVNGSWLQIQLPSAIIIKQYQIALRASSPVGQNPLSWTLAGSTNGSTWNTITQISNYKGFTSGVYASFIIQNNTISYTHYRLIISNTDGSGGETVVGIGEWKLFADIPLATTAREYPPLPMTANTSYLNGTYGAGTYVASASSIFDPSNEPLKAFDKIDEAGGAASRWVSLNRYTVNVSYSGPILTFDYLNNIYRGEWLQIKLAVSIILSSYGIATQVTNLPSSWWILGSEDGTTWYNLDRRTSITFPNRNLQTYTISNNSRYFSYYRFVCDVISLNNSVAIAEWKLFGTQSAYPKYRTALPSTQTTYAPGTYTTYANTQYNATTADATPPLFVTDKLLATPWKTGASNYTSAADASPAPAVFFELPSAIRLASYRMTAPDTSEAPSAWSVYGSNMNVAGGWLLLDARTAVVAPWATSLTQTFALPSPASAFDFYRVDLLRNCSSTGDFIALNELRLIGDDATPEPRFAIGTDGRVAVNVAPAAVNASAAMTVGGNLAVNGAIRADNLGMFRNRVINGDMRIDQRYAGASNIVAAASTGIYHADRWRISNGATSAALTVQRVRAPANPYGHAYALAAIATTAQTPLNNQDYVTLEQRIEGFNVADLAWGTAYAQPATVSFAAYSTQAGQYSLSLRNATNTASYVAPFAIPVANQWVRVEQTVPGETTAAWEIENGLGLSLAITLAAGSNWTTSDVGRWQESSRAPSGLGYLAATGGVNFVGTANNQFYLTGVQLEKGTIATPFEARPLGVELALCQRYYETNPTSMPYVAQPAGSYSMAVWTFKQRKRAIPAMTIYGAISTVSFITEDAYGGYTGSGVASVIGANSSASSEL